MTRPWFVITDRDWRPVPSRYERVQRILDDYPGMTKRGPLVSIRWPRLAWLKVWWRTEVAGG